MYFKSTPRQLSYCEGGLVIDAGAEALAAVR